MIKVVSVTRLARDLSHWIDVAQKEAVIIVRYGKPVVTMVPYELEENDDDASVSG